MRRVFVGMGSNLHDPHAQLQQARAALQSWVMDGSFECSGFYRSAPMGPQDQPDYLNAVAGWCCGWSADELLGRLQEQEQKQGRVRQRRWGERSLDLDLLLYGDELIHEPHLQVPHPGLCERAFVLRPLMDLVGETYALSDGRCLNACAMQADMSSVTPWSET